MRNGTQTTAVRIEDEHLSPLGPNGRRERDYENRQATGRVDDDKTLPFLDEPRSNLPDAETTTSFAPDVEITSNSPDGSAELADGTSTAAATRHTANTRTNELSARAVKTQSATLQGTSDTHSRAGGELHRPTES